MEKPRILGRGLIHSMQWLHVTSTLEKSTLPHSQISFPNTAEGCKSVNKKVTFVAMGGAAEQAAAPWRLPPRLSLVLKDEAVASGAVFVPLQDKLINK